MMETKLLAAFCALLVLNVGYADHEENHDADSPVSTSEPEEVGGLAPGSFPEPTNHTHNNSGSSPTLNGTSSNTTTGNQTIPMAHKPREDNATDVSLVTTSFPEKDESTTNQTPSQPPVIPSESSPSASHIPPHTPSVATPLTTPSSNHSNMSNPSVSLAPGSSSTSTPTQTETPSSTSAQTPEKQMPQTSPTTTPATTTRPSSTSSTSLTHKSTSPQQSTGTSQPSRTPITSSKAQLKSTATPLSNTSVQARTQAESPSQLNMGGDSANGPPTLDPLLAGLVSAFILTAVIITLLLFLKLRQRNNRPEFRRLQDLPMDDMMEDTPLSMYSY